MKYKKLMAGLLLGVSSLAVHAEQIGSVDTVFKMFGPDHKIVVEAFDDPDVKNVTCYVSRAKTGALKAGWGWLKTPRMRPFPASRLARWSSATKLRAVKRTVTWSLKSVRRWCLNRYRLCVSTTKNATCSPIWPIPTRWWTVRQKTRLAPYRLCRGALRQSRGKKNGA